jgi:hypothetical protein
VTYAKALEQLRRTFCDLWVSYRRGPAFNLAGTRVGWRRPLIFGVCDFPKGLLGADGAPQSGKPHPFPRSLPPACCPAPGGIQLAARFSVEFFRRPRAAQRRGERGVLAFAGMPTGSGLRVS